MRSSSATRVQQGVSRLVLFLGAVNAVQAIRPKSFHRQRIGANRLASLQTAAENKSDRQEAPRNASLLDATEQRQGQGRVAALRQELGATRPAAEDRPPPEALLERYTGSAAPDSVGQDCGSPGLCSSWLWDRAGCSPLWCPEQLDSGPRWLFLMMMCSCPWAFWMLFVLCSVCNYAASEECPIAFKIVSAVLPFLRRRRSSGKDGCRRIRSYTGNLQARAFYPDVVFWRGLSAVFFQTYVVSSVLTTWRMCPMVLVSWELEWLASVLNAANGLAWSVIRWVTVLFLIYFTCQVFWWRQVTELGKAIQQKTTGIASLLCHCPVSRQESFTAYRYLMLHFVYSMAPVAPSFNGFSSENLESLRLLELREAQVLAACPGRRRLLAKWLCLWIGTHVRCVNVRRRIFESLREARTAAVSLQEMLDAPVSWHVHEALYFGVRLCIGMLFLSGHIEGSPGRQLVLESPIELTVVKFMLVAAALQTVIETLYFLRHPFGIDGVPGSQALFLETEGMVRLALCGGNKAHLFKGQT